MGSNAYDRADVLAAINQRIEGTVALHEACDAADAAETPEQWLKAQNRIRDVLATNNRTKQIWLRKWTLQGRL